MTDISGGTGVGGRRLRGATLSERIIAGTLASVARRGVARSTLDDIAAEAGCSRASVYRTFPGGKAAVLRATGEHEVQRFFAEVAVDLDRTPTLRDLLTTILTRSGTVIQGHAALQYLLRDEPGAVLPYISFHGLDPLLRLASTYGAPHLERFLAPADARATAEWLARLVVSYLVEPSELGIDLTDHDDADRLVATYLLPGLQPGVLTGSAA